jgi:glycosyltransferase involved in cell wall biosynthesis
MQIFIDNLIFSLQKAGGISVYWSELMQRMNNTQQNITCIDTKDSGNFLAKPLNWQKNTLADNALPITVKRFLPLLKTLPEQSIFHSSYLRWSNQKNVANIVTIHDLAPEHGMIGGKGKYIRQWQQRKAIEHADGILCVSNTVKNDLLNYYSFLDESKVKAVYHGVSEHFFSLEKNGAKESFILFVGHRSGYKNFDLAVDVVRSIPNMKLVIVGGKELSEEENSLLNNKLPNRYEYKSLIGVEALNELYNAAFCLLYPSSFEGFGLPIVEAMKVGCPVVTSNKAAIPEIARGGALLVDDLSVKGFVAAIELLKENGVRAQLIEKGKVQADRFCWNSCFEETMDFYSIIWNNKFS